VPESQSFDITTGCDLQEVDNAVNQASRELQQRYDFKNVPFELTYKRQENLILIAAPDAYKLAAITEVMQAKMVRRGVPVKNLDKGEIQQAHGQSVRQEIKLLQAIETEKAKQIVKYVKELKLKKVQAAILGEQIRVTGPSRDDLQTLMQGLRQQDFGIELQYGNYR
jgi:uncharacterized protein YajQ (UPF0234 family)